MNAIALIDGDTKIDIDSFLPQLPSSELLRLQRLDLMPSPCRLPDNHAAGLCGTPRHIWNHPRN
ncbi:MAG: hypothetical protein WAV07_06715 [Candidatus Contendobacter sp.]